MFFVKRRYRGGRPFGFKTEFSFIEVGVVRAFLRGKIMERDAWRRGEGNRRKV